MKQVLVVNNPNAGRRKALKYKKAVLKYLFNKNLTFKSISIEELENINFDEFDTIIAIGGDGTVNKLIPFVINTKKILGIIPCGTANLLAAKLNIPVNIHMALKIIDNQTFSKIDTFKVNDKFSILRFGLGFDADIICNTPQSLKNKFGYFAYFIAGILFALRLKQRQYNLYYDNKKHSVVATCLIAANAGNMFKNIFSVSKNCKLNDNLMDIFILKVKNPIMFFFEFLQIIFNIKISGSKAMYFQTSALNIKNDFFNCHLDGEKHKFKDEVNITIIPESVKVFSNI